MNNFYVCIKEPDGLRKDILGCTKGILHSLQNYEDYKDIKAKKDAYMSRLMENVDQIKILSQRLFSIMPEFDEKIIPVKTEKKVKMSISDLNEEIEEIEKKISAMGL